MTSDRSTEILAELPDGVIDRLAASLAEGRRRAGTPMADAAALRTEAEQRLLLPVTAEVDWPRPTPPLPVGGSDGGPAGAVHADLIDADREALTRLRATLSDTDRDDPEAVAAAAQGWRLPITPYRRADEPAARTVREAALRSAVPGEAALRAESPRPSRTAGGAPRSGPATTGRRRDTPVVIDLSALWAGPLATSLLADQGATVIKVDGEVRPDGLRNRPAVYRALNGAKEIVDLDLRRGADRRRFDELLAGADLLVDSFSRRVLPNLGYDPATLTNRFPHLISLGITAFPPGCPEAEWVAYGPGVHAAVGLARQVEQRWRPAPIAYPDALAGAEAFAVAAGALACPTPGRRLELSLAGAVAPLADEAASASAGSRGRS